MLEAFNQELMRCFDSGELKEYGIPNIEQIAEKLGFEYPPYFSRLFKKKEGISPSEYRELYRMN